MLPRTRSIALRRLLRGAFELVMDASRGAQMSVLTPDQQRIREAISRLCAGFGDAYWLERDRQGGFPEEFYAAVARDGWLGIAMPEEYGGAGLGLGEAATPMQAGAQSRAPFSGASAVHMNILRLKPLGKCGTAAHKRRLPPP